MNTRSKTRARRRGIVAETPKVDDIETVFMGRRD